MKNDIYQSVTDEVIRQIESGAPPWAKPWAGGASKAAETLAILDYLESFVTKQE